ncbi:4-hydroxythreonine-4-phosphate dehydrogenase PdxA [Halalkalibacter akibai]|uniref:4-hydroxythreonine-4-phosphate dehydrogenase n=1 Tax=Halalkalibacter akibai (strain ATCC 43226 / DSM 21942 / CIP 109018 / JCM 9157 / 1139) TaxID=1236973 RepID=W4QW14_HALA3|nr:4-hydroxythreonine-4-phosphate dehydrogenase PdxA [Halalkalibacter akibai]GAE35499.1 4-hydroxythreonine-4-phosphate dehydrogenase [Halalkalibacter akibai JCM 9157]
MKPIIAITMGDASGVGPEIIIKALQSKKVYEMARPLVIGDVKILKREVRHLGIELNLRVIEDPDDGMYQQGTVDVIDLDLVPEDLPYGQVSAKAGHAAYCFIEKAVKLALDERINGICTAPLNKEALHKGGHLYPGHTEILADLTQTEDYSMMLTATNLKVIHLTTHVGIIEAINRINPERTYKVVKLAHETLVRAGYAKPKIAVCGINPHAGENGLFGNGEEEEKLVPGIKQAQAEGIEVTGPYPADTLFYRGRKGEFDMVVACYHDQGHGPIKVLGLETGVNITVGLKKGVIRTSVDHGTAFDIAGKKRADERSLLEAIYMAVDLAPKFQ